MRDRRLGAEEVAPDHLAIALETVALVRRKKCRAVGAIERRQLVPRDARILMVHVVEIVVEEQQAEDRRRLDDDGAPAWHLMRLVLGEGAKVEHREPEIGARHVGPERNAADDVRPREHDDEPDGMANPCAEDLLVAFYDEAELAAANPTAITSGPTVKRPTKVLLKSSTFWIQSRQHRPVADRVIEGSPDRHRDRSAPRRCDGEGAAP